MKDVNSVCKCGSGAFRPARPTTELILIPAEEVCVIDISPIPILGDIIRSEVLERLGRNYMRGLYSRFDAFVSVFAFVLLSLWNAEDILLVLR